MSFGSIDCDHTQMVEYNLCGGFGFQKDKLCVDKMKNLCFIIFICFKIHFLKCKYYGNNIHM
jgi:hypothetical protein